MLPAIFKSPGWAGENSNDPELDALLVAADAALDPEDRIVKIGEVIAYILDNAVMTPVLTPAIDDALHGNVNGFKLDVANVPHYTDVWLAPE
jgi:ABC-type transport system substrate-binding protein